MGAAIVLREQLDVFVTLATLHLVLDTEVGELHPFVDIRQVAILCPTTDLLLVAVRSAIAVRPVAVPLLKELLVFPLQILFEDDAADLDGLVFHAEPRFLLAICCVEVGIVVDLAGAAHARVERLWIALVWLSAVGVEQVAALLREDDGPIGVAQRDVADEPLVAEVVQRVSVDLDVTFRHHAEGADGRQRAAVLVVQLVRAVAIDDQLALVAARQVEVVHKPIARVLIVPVAFVVHARPAVIELAPITVAHIVPSRIGHGRPPSMVLSFGCP